jgi:hypothetical protein
MNYLGKDYKGWRIVDDVTINIYRKFKCECSVCGEFKELNLSHLQNKLLNIPCLKCGMNKITRTKYKENSHYEEHPIYGRFTKLKDKCKEWKYFIDFLKWYEDNTPDLNQSFELTRKDFSLPHSPENSYFKYQPTYSFSTLYDITFKEVEKSSIYQMFEGTCSCGKTFKMSGVKISKLKTSPCECKRQPCKNTSPVFRLWYGIDARCKSNDKNYGGRGIKMCQEWQEDFWKFSEWCLNNGYEKGLEMDRIDVNGNYTPTNCRFITGKKNSQNKRTTKLNEEIVKEIRYGQYKDLSSYDISKIIGCSSKTIRDIQQLKTWV